MLFFDDEASSRRHIDAKNAIFWRRNLFSSPFWGEKCSILATRPLLVTILNRKLLLFGDETYSRRHFEAINAIFWRRDPFSSPFWTGNCSILATRPLLVTILNRKLLLFGDETYSLRHFEARNAIFWRRDPFSSPFWTGNCSFLAARPLLVTILRREMLFFDDETFSRHHFEPEIAPFWRRNLFSSPFWGEKCSILATRPFLVVILRREMLFFDDETLSRRHFEARNAIFRRRDPFSSPFWTGNCSFLATKLILVVILRREMLFFDDETFSRHHFEARNAIFWRRDLFSSPFWGNKCYILTTRPFLVVILGREMLYFDDEAPSRRHIDAKNAIFWRRNTHPPLGCET